MGDEFLDRLANLNGDNVGGPDDGAAQEEEEDDATDAFLKRLAQMDLSGAPPGCAPMRDTPFVSAGASEEGPADGAPPPTSSPTPKPKPKPKPKAKPKPKPKKKAEPPSEQPPPPSGGDDVNIEEALNSSVWKDRKAAYEQMARCFDRKANFQEYSSFFEKALEEKNKMAYKELAKAFVSFAKNAPDDLINQHMPTILEQTTPALGDNSKMYLMQMWSAALETLEFDVWHAKAAEAIKCKARKVAGVAVEIVSQCLSEFGADVCDANTCLDWAIDLCKTSSDSAVKAGAQEILVKLYGDLGDGVNDAIEEAEVKKAIVKSLKKKFKKAKPITVTKYRRGDGPSEGGGDDGGGDSPAPKKAKPKPKPKKVIKLKGKDVFADLDKEFEENLGGSGWKPKKAGLDQLCEAIENVKAISCGARFAIVKQKLPELCGDTNVNVMVAALKVAGLLAEKMEPKDFLPCAKAIIPHAVPAYKQKKTTVKLYNDQMFRCFLNKVGVKFTDLKDPFIEGMKDRQAVYKTNVLEFLQMISQDEELQPKLVDDIQESDLCDALVGCLKDKDAKIRKAAAVSLGHIGGFTQNSTFLDVIDGIQESNKNAYKNIAPVLKSYEGKAPVGADDDEPESEPSPPPKKKKKKAAEPASDEEEVEPAPKKKEAKKKKGKKGSKSSKKSGGRKAKSKHMEEDQAAGDKDPISAKDKSLDKYGEGGSMSSDDANEVIAELLDGIDIDDVDATKWPQRQAALEAILEKVKEGGVDHLAVIRFFMYKGIKQSNANASKMNVQILVEAIRMDPDVEAANALIPMDDAGMWPLFGDRKCVELCKEYMEVVCEAIGPKIFIPFMLAKMPGDSRGAKVREPTMQVMEGIVRDYGMSSTNWKFMMMKCHEYMNGGARGGEKDAIIELFSHCYRQTGPYFRNTLFTSVNNKRAIASMQEALDPIEEDGTQGKFEPTKKPRNGDFAEPLNMDTLVPRKDLSKEMDASAKKLSDGGWKVRKEGCDEIEEILKANGHRMQPKVPGSMWAGLRNMQKDTNNNLKIIANRVVSGLVAAGGEKMIKQSKEILPNVFETCGEGAKPVARAAAEAVKVWCMNTDYTAMTKCSGPGLGNPKARPHLMPVVKEVLEHYDGKGAEMDLGDEFLVNILKCCIDKDAKIKTATKAFFPLIVKHVGGKTVMKTIGNEFSSGEQSTLQKGLKKFLGDLEEEPKKGKKKGKKDGKKKKEKEKKGKKKAADKEEEPPPEPEEPEDDCPLKVNTKMRKSRLSKKRRYKGSWVEHQAGELKKMKKWSELCMDKDFRELCLGDRSEWKQWQEAMKIYLDLLKDNPAPFLNNADMILQWSCLKCMENKATNSDMGFMNFWKSVCEYYITNEMMMEHHEADQFLPMIVERCNGSMKKQVSELGKLLFELAESCYSPIWMSRYLWDNFDVSKNGRARVASLQELNRLFTDYGIELIAKKPGKKQLLVALYKHMNSADNTIRKEALPIFCTFAHILGKEKVLKVISKAPAKIKDLIANRLSKVTFDLPFSPGKSNRYMKAKDGEEPPPPEPKKGKKGKKAKAGGAPTAAAPAGAAPDTAPAPMAAPEQPQMQDIPQQFQPARRIEFTPEDLNSLPAAFQPINWGAFSTDTTTSAKSAFDFSLNTDGVSTSVRTNSGIGTSGFSSSVSNLPGFEMFNSTFAMPTGMAFPEPSTLAPPETIPDIIAGLESKRSDCLEVLAKGFKSNKWSDEALKPHTKRLVSSLITWWQDILNNGDAIGPTEKQTLSENLIECLFDISQKPSVLATLSMESLETFIRIMLISLISHSVRSSFSNRKVLIARLNDITLGVLQNCDRTMAFYILISFLKQAEPEETSHPIESSANFSNVVVKCLAKLMILIPKVIRTMKVDQILQVIHQFFTLKPPKVWNRPGCNNKPYRVARTCLSKFVEFKGPEILQDLRKVVGVNPNPKPVIQLFTEEFIEKKFPNYDLDNPATKRAGSGTSILRSSSSSLKDFVSAPINHKGVSDAQIHQQLSQIVDHLDPAERGYGDAGLQRLHDFLQAHPQADLETCLVGKSDVFQGFVRRGLGEIEKSSRPAYDGGTSPSGTNRRSRLNRARSNASMSSISSLPDTNTSKMSTEDLRERLNKLRNSSVARTSRKRDNSISIDNIRDRLAKFQTNTVGRQDSIASTRQDSVLGHLNREASIGSNMTGLSGLGGLNREPSVGSTGLGSLLERNSVRNDSGFTLPHQTSSNSVISSENTERRQSTTLSDLRARLNKIKQNS